MNYRREILDEFEDYETFDYTDNFSIGEVIGHLGGVDFSTRKRNTKFHKVKDIATYEQISLFAKTLTECGDFIKAKKIAGICHKRAVYYVNFLNNEAEDRGLPKIFNCHINTPYVKKGIWRRPIVKLDETKVSCIRKLLNNHSTYKISKLYNVSQSTIHQIKHGFTWKNVKAAI